jgi:hypothetical protein
MSDQDFYAGLSFASELKQVGIDGLRTHVEAGTWKTLSPFKHGEAIEVVRRFDASKAEAASAKRDAREEETLSIAKEANDIARSASFAASAAAASASEANTIARSNSRRAWRAEIIAAIAATAAIVAAIAAVMGVK